MYEFVFFYLFNFIQLQIVFHNPRKFYSIPILPANCWQMFLKCFWSNKMTKRGRVSKMTKQWQLHQLSQRWMSVKYVLVQGLPLAPWAIVIDWHLLLLRLGNLWSKAVAAAAGYLNVNAYQKLLCGLYLIAKEVIVELN